MGRLSFLFLGFCWILMSDSRENWVFVASVVGE